jgi:outer membrane protein TolC
MRLMRPFKRPASIFALMLGAFLLFPPATWAQRSASDVNSTGTSLSQTSEPLELTLTAAVQTALEENLDLRGAQLDMRDANAQVREAWGNLYPSLDLTGSYTRNVVTANPFAGSDVTSFFGGGGQTEWLAYNERQRLDGDPTTQPISFQEFQQRQAQSIQEAGISLDSGGDNPFGVDNEFRGGLQLTQTLYSKRAFASVKGAQQLKDASKYTRNREVQVVTNEVVTAFYQALLAQERVRVRKQRVGRAKETFEEVSLQVDRGVVPKAQRLGAEVELSNARTQMINARNAADLARDNLKRVMGISPERPIKLKGELDKEPNDGLQQISLDSISMQKAVTQAIENRPDLERARLNVELRDIQKEQNRAAFYPNVQAVANFSYSGRVPDDRPRVETTDPNPANRPNPFYFNEINRGFFDDDFWNPSLSVGLQLSWNLFSGFQRTSRLQQAEIQRQRAEIQLEQLRQGVKVEVRRAVRDLENARERIETQETNVRRAKQNYDHISDRVDEGVARQIELREASDQLDQSRLNYLQAVYDYLVARSDLETALGQPLTPSSESYLMTSR